MPLLFEEYALGYLSRESASQDDGGGPAAGGVVGATPEVPRDDDDDDDGGDDDADGGARSRRKQARAVAAYDDEDDAIPSQGHPPVLRLSGRAPLTLCSYSRSLQSLAQRKIPVWRPSLDLDRRQGHSRW